MRRYIITGSGYVESDRLTEKLAQVDFRSSGWYPTTNELQVLEAYKFGETRRMTNASFKPGLVSAFERLLKRGFIVSEEI